MDTNMATNETASKEGGGEFQAFLNAVGAFIPVWCAKLTALIGESDRARVMKLYTDAIQATWNGAAGELSRSYRGLGTEARGGLDNSVTASGMLAFVKGATSLLEGGELVSAESILDIGSIFEKIKQFIWCIWRCLDL